MALMFCTDIWRKAVIEENKDESLNPYRNMVLEEVAQAIEKMEGFGQDTIASFCIFIREMKK
jgi:hypothetical protein